MSIFFGTASLPAFSDAVVTTGSFDGVHKGHLQIIRLLQAEAEKTGGPAIVITFYPHPKKIVGSQDSPLQVLNTPAEKYGLLQKAGITDIVELKFDAEFAALSADAYISDFLLKYFKPAVMVIGYDHRFGKNREGDFRLLEKAGAEHNFRVKEIPAELLHDVTISSTAIRQALLAGNIFSANELLGYQYFFSGTVVPGNKLGRTIGYPTANLHIDDTDKLIPANGVYAVRAALDGRELRGMMNIGVRPTVSGTARAIEVNIFDFDEDIYGQTLRVTVLERLRDEIEFSGLDALKSQLALDAEIAQKLFSK